MILGMKKPTKAQAEKFQDVEVDAFVVAGTVLAFEFGVGEEASCVVCGAKLRNVFLTNYGCMGGDCLAILTGDQSTRKEVQKVLKALDSQYREARALHVQASTYRAHEQLSSVFAEYDSDYGSGTFKKCIAVAKSQAVRFAVAVWADQHPRVQMVGI